MTLNLGHAADAAESAVGAELLIEIMDALRPVVFRSADDGTYSSLIMPILEEPDQAPT